MSLFTDDLNTPDPRQVPHQVSRHDLGILTLRIPPSLLRDHTKVFAIPASEQQTKALCNLSLSPWSLPEVPGHGLARQQGLTVYLEEVRPHSSRMHT